MAILHFGLSIALFLAGGIAAEICRGNFTRPRGASRGNRRVKRRSFLLPTPLGYEGLEGLRTGSDDDTQGLVMGSRLGLGSYGVVYNGRWRGARVAVKILEHGGRNKKESMQVAREAAVGEGVLCEHPPSRLASFNFLLLQISDVWSCGVVLYTMMTAVYPFARDADDTDVQRHHKIIQRIKKGDYKFPRKFKASTAFFELLHCMLLVEPERRITIAEIQKHPWYLHMLPEGVASANDQHFLEPLVPQVLQTLEDVTDLVHKAQSLQKERILKETI